MELNRKAIALWVWSVVATMGGIALIILAPAPFPIVGVLGIIAGLIGLMPALYFTME